MFSVGICIVDVSFLDERHHTFCQLKMATEIKEVKLFC